jgi:hypothetical protein
MIFPASLQFLKHIRQAPYNPAKQKTFPVNARLEKHLFISMDIGTSSTAMIVIAFLPTSLKTEVVS